MQLRFRLGLAQAGDPLAFFPLAAFPEQLQALKALEHIPFAAQGGGRPQTAMLRHNSNSTLLAGWRSNRSRFETDLLCTMTGADLPIHNFVSAGGRRKTKLAFGPGWF
jgi:hypothetical protein